MIPHVRLLKAFTGHRDAVYALQPFDDLFLSAGSEGMVVVWDEPPRALLRTSVPIYAFYADEKLVVAGQNDGKLLFVDLADNRLASSVKAHQQAVFSIVVVSSMFVVAGGDGYLSLWERETYAHEGTLAVSAQSLRALAVHPTLPLLAAGGTDRFIRVFDTNNFSQLASFEAHLSTVFALAFDDDYLYSAGRDARLRKWAVHEDFNLTQEVMAHHFSIHALRLSPDGAYLATGSMDKTIKLWDAADLRLLKVIDYARHEAHTSSVNTLLWRPDGTLLSSGDDRRILQWAIDF